MTMTERRLPQPVSARPGLLTLIVLPGLLAAGAGGCKMPKPKLRVHEVIILPSQGQTAGLNIRVDVYNPYLVPIWLKDFRCRIESGGALLASGKARLPIDRFGARRTTPVEVLADVQTREFQKIWSKLLAGQAVHYRLTARGVFSLLGLGVPVEITKKRRLKPPKFLRWLTPPAAPPKGPQQ